MTVDTLHKRLRAETDAAHQDLEHAVDFDGQLKSPHAYVGYLSRLLVVHRAAERAVSNYDFAPLGFDYSNRRKSQHLKADLDHVGGPHAWNLDEAERPSLTLGSLEEALGVVYVIEGSSLGARAVLPQIKQALGYDETAGATYFAGLGEDGKLLWRACLAAINAVPVGSADARRVIEGAHAGFALFRLWLPEIRQSLTEAHA